MKKVLMLIALIFGTTVMVNANTISLKANATKEVKTNKLSKHRVAKKAIVAKNETSKNDVSKAKK